LGAALNGPSAVYWAPQRINHAAKEAVAHRYRQEFAGGGYARSGANALIIPQHHRTNLVFEEVEGEGIHRTVGRVYLYYLSHHLMREPAITHNTVADAHDRTLALGFGYPIHTLDGG
jgi:hypothetical protein